MSTDIRTYLQNVLDTALSEFDIRSYHLRRIDETDADEYIVYTLSGRESNAFSDDEELIRTSNVVIRYYYRDSLNSTSEGRARIREVENLIETSLCDAGFYLPNGFFDAGDIEDIGFGATVFEASLQEVI